LKFAFYHVKIHLLVVYLPMRGLINKGDLFQFARWFNLSIGVLNLYYYISGGSYFLFYLGAANIGVWVFSRKEKGDS